MKLTIDENASAQLLAAKKDYTVTDALGRVIGIRKPKALDSLDFKMALGNNHANTVWLVSVSHLPYVYDIDGEPVITPRTESELRHLYKKLDDEGNEAVQKFVIEHFFSDTAKAEEETELKNS